MKNLILILTAGLILTACGKQEQGNAKFEDWQDNWTTSDTTGGRSLQYRRILDCRQLSYERRTHYYLNLEAINEGTQTISADGKTAVTTYANVTLTMPTVTLSEQNYTVRTSFSFGAPVDYKIEEDLQTHENIAHILASEATLARIQKDNVQAPWNTLRVGTEIFTIGTWKGLTVNSSLFQTELIDNEKPLECRATRAQESSHQGSALGQGSNPSGSAKKAATQNAQKPQGK